MGRHETPDEPEPRRTVRRAIARHALHPVVHILTLVTLHVVAFTVVEKTPLLTLLFLH